VGKPPILEREGRRPLAVRDIGENIDGSAGASPWGH
jgi:hypothetical protein